MEATRSREAKFKAKRVKAILFDVDGVLTNGSIVFDANGEEIKTFNSKDGQIISHLQRMGFKLGIITGRESKAVRNRCKSLKLDFAHHGVENKKKSFDEFKDLFGFDEDEIAYIGDDIIDLKVLISCGFSGTPNDAFSYMRKNVDFICSKNGGAGAFREFADYIIESQGLMSTLIKSCKNGEAFE